MYGVLSIFANLSDPRLLQEFQPANLVECCHQQVILMIEPSIYGKNLSTVELVASAMKFFFAAFPSDFTRVPETGNPLAIAAVNIQKQLLRVLSKYVDDIS